MKQTISIELTEDQINKIVEARQPKISLQPETFSIIGASKILNISKSTIFKLIREGKINKIWIGKSPRITKSEIEKFLGNVEGISS